MNESRPVRGAWIEIEWLSPEMYSDEVAPRTGRVD